jgi:hypothetical protein
MFPLKASQTRQGRRSNAHAALRGTIKLIYLEKISVMFHAMFHAQIFELSLITTLLELRLPPVSRQ